MLFGAPPPCGEKDCDGGHVFWDSITNVYRCSGHTSGWGKCTFEVTQDEIKMRPYKLPEWKKDIPGLKGWKFQKRQRTASNTIVRAAVTEDMQGRTEEEIREAKKKRRFYDVGKSMEKPFEGYTFVFYGKFSVPIPKLSKTAQSLGATVVSGPTPSVTHCISTPKKVSELDSEDDILAKAKISPFEKVIKYDIPILSEDWIHETEEQAQFLKQTDYLLGGSGKAQSILKREFSDPEKEVDTTASTEKKVKLVLKGRCAVDPLCGEDVVEQYHVLDQGGKNIFNVVLNNTDIEKGMNSYYALQLLESDKKGGATPYKVFRKWGRIGTKSGGKKIEDFDDLEDAIKSFESLYYDKTENEWKKRDSFEKKPNKFFPIEIDYSTKEKANISDVKSKLDPTLQSLISLIFDVKIIEQSLMEMEIDLKKMPLGKLSKKHIMSGYEVLRAIDTVLDDSDLNERKKHAKLVALTNQFYTLIPHDFGARDPTIIDSKDTLNIKMKLMEALIDIEIAATLLDVEGKEGESPIDSNYAKLHTTLKTLEHDSEEFGWISKYLNNQKGHYKNATLVDCFMVDREGADGVYDTVKHLGNRQLLWHGSRVSNYVGILSQGLRIAPPEAPKSGYRFGKGIYFADLCEKSIGYCRGVGSDFILMMLVEVALGKQKELLKDQYMEKALPGFHSTKAMGAWAPKEQMVLPNGVVVPYGGPKKTGITSSCEHNEYIVYTVPQACIRYLLKIKLNDM
eukprot:TRINITY_DN4472_c0_g1_i6.p1 TRINITY_DN4472_c0_g1~~TRINITY_DN4472_c0_g1_i6.p1  ORF type:complete len:736 (-),score=193.89 TRINITY_DN4472_c0_g1_i6:181-2388(-)